jgi:ribosomal protein S18 acetylase RimI-like enzyme
MAHLTISICRLYLYPVVNVQKPTESVLPDHYALIAASVREAYQNEYAGGRFSEEYDLDTSAYVAQLSGPKHDPVLWQVAWDGDQVAGQVLPVIEQGRAEVFEVSVRPTWRRRGLARGLLSRALQTLRERGMDVIRLHTVAEFRTRARDLYGSLGFRVLKEFPRYRKPFNVDTPIATCCPFGVLV